MIHLPPSKFWLAVIILFGLGGFDAAADELVPFMGCPTDGAGFDPQKVPTGNPQPVKLSHFLAQKLAWYEDSGGVGVLAPRGWTCFALYGSGGHKLQVGNPGRFNQMVAVRTATSVFSGRYNVARLLNQFFPEGHEHFIAEVIVDWKNITGEDGVGQIKEPRSTTDQIRYRSANTFDFVTPAGMFGIGTFSTTPSPYRIVGRGCVIEQADSPDFSVLSVALPDNEQASARAIAKNWDGCDQ